MKGQVSPARTKGQVATLAAVLAALGSALALFVMRGAILPATRASIAASRDRAVHLPATWPAHIRSVPVIEMTTPQLASHLSPDEGPASGEPSLRNTPGPARPVPATAAAGLPASPRRVAQAPLRKVPRKSSRTASAGASGESIEDVGAARAPVLASPSCDPPYVIDDEGIKRFKPSCL